MSRGTTPRAALKPNERTLWVMRSETAVPETIRIGLSDGSDTEVLAGQVRTGDRVVVEATLTAAGTKQAP